MRAITWACLLSAFSIAAHCKAAERDLRDHPVVGKIERLLPKIGNQGSKKVDYLVIDDQTLVMKGRIRVKASHKWGRVRAPTASNWNRKVDIAASKTLTGEFTYDCRTGDYSGEVSLGTVSLSAGSHKLDFGEVKIDTDVIEELIQGDLYDLLEIIPNPAPEVLDRKRENEYESVVSSKESLHGINNVFFVREGWVDWASAERLGYWAVEAVLTSGASLDRVMQEEKDQTQPELSRMISWMEGKGIAHAEDLAKRIARGDKVTDLGSIKLKWRPIKYRSRVIVFGNPSPWVEVSHGCFYLVFTGPGGSRNIDRDNPDPNNPNDPAILGTDLPPSTESMF